MEGQRAALYLLEQMTDTGKVCVVNGFWYGEIPCCVRLSRHFKVRVSSGRWMYTRFCAPDGNGVISGGFKGGATLKMLLQVF
jgi:hypothetical protein